MTWAHDVSGNAVATATFAEPADTLVVDSLAELTLDVDEWPVFEIAASASTYPLLLSEDEMADLGALRLKAYLDSAGRLREWARGFVAGARTDTLSLLKTSAPVSPRRSSTSSATTRLRRRRSLVRGRGSCRDLAALFVDAVRSLGFRAWVVSGYLHDPDRDAVGSARAGWTMFDPTNRSVGGFNLIPVAVARHIRQTMPVSGSFIGDPAALEALEVAVTVEHALA